MKVLLVDDHPLILSALQTLLEAMADGITVLSAESASAMHQVLAREADVQLVLLDLTLADAAGFSTLEALRERHPELPVVVVSATDRMADVVRAIDLGAMGFVPKRSSTAELHAALALAMSGSVYIPSALLGLASQPAAGEPGGWAGVVEQLSSGSAGEASASAVPLAVAGAAADAAAAGRLAGQSGLSALAAQTSASYATLGLTPRQSEVLVLLLKGLSNKLIARELKLSVETVKDHVAAVLRALGVSSRTQAVLAVGQLQQLAGQRGLPLR